MVFVNNKAIIAPEFPTVIIERATSINEPSKILQKFAIAYNECELGNKAQYFKDPIICNDPIIIKDAQAIIAKLN